MVKIEGTLAEIRDLFVDAAVSELKTQATKAGTKVVSSAVKKTRSVAKSAWQKYMGNKRTQIKFKSGKRKGQLDLKRMGVAFRKSNRGKK